MDKLRIDLSNQIYTQSEISLLDLCPFKWYLKYQQKLELIGAINWNFLVGTVWHKAMESLYQSKGKDLMVCNIANEIPEDVIINQEVEKEIEYWQNVLEATLQGYATFYRDDFKRFKVIDYEKAMEVTLEIDGLLITIAGKRDMKVKYGDNIATIDHKTSSQISPSLTEGWAYKFQFMLYLWLDWQLSLEDKRTNKFLVNVVKKTQLRWGKGEHINTFAARVKAAILGEPTAYFYRQELDLTAKGIMTFEKTLLIPKLKRFAILQKQPELQEAFITKNTDACNYMFQQCEFFQLCYHGEEKQYKTREIKHVELAE